jgi:hypothetical protein
MAKNILFCADGTWNGPGQSDTDDPTAPWTNVFKVFLNLAGDDDPDSTQLAKEQGRTLVGPDGGVQQVAKYLNGVGDSGNWLDQMLGGGLGFGLITRIVRGYTFVSRNYQAGDRVYLIGFSRGAYTARALAGLIAAKGLLPQAAFDPADKAPGYRAGSAVWYQWRKERLIATGRPVVHLEEIMLDLPHFFTQPPDPASMIAADIEAVCVWDTVGALGIPVFNGQHVDVDLFQFADTKLGATVRQARHAISIDEEREDFTPTLWDADPRIVQVLFPGAHADVGGGYQLAGIESGLSNGALAWMLGELKGLGVLLGPPPRIDETPVPDGPAHRPWLQPLWRMLPIGPRQLRDGLGLSKSVIDRLAAVSVLGDPSLPLAPYRPQNIPGYLNGLGPAPGIDVV